VNENCDWPIVNPPSSRCRTAAPISSSSTAHFSRAGGTPDQYRAGIERAIASGWLWLHESGTYVKFTPGGAELFA
jgi:hypothetical protein